MGFICIFCSSTSVSDQTNLNYFLSAFIGFSKLKVLPKTFHFYISQTEIKNGIYLYTGHNLWLDLLFIQIVKVSKLSLEKLKRLHMFVLVFQRRKGMNQRKCFRAQRLVAIWRTATDDTQSDSAICQPQRSKSLENLLMPRFGECGFLQECK